MDATIETSIAMPKALLEQAEVLAQQRGISLNDLIAAAIEQFIRHHPHPAPTQNVVVNQGDIYWIQVESDFPHPHVVVQDDVLNHSRIHTVVVCALTSNIQRVSVPGNLLLEAGEANLTRQSVVEVAKVSTVAKAQLGEYIGSLSTQRVEQILAALRFLQSSFFTH